MADKYQDFIHPSDRKALEALKAVPGFDAIVKKFMSIVGEKMFKIESTSSYLQLGPDQSPEIHAILVKICKKLNIHPIPDLFLALDRTPNAYTYGDTDIFIVIHSGLLETLSPKQIETVIAHECGHIVCHHTLFTTMGSLLMRGAEFFVNGWISRAVVTSLQYAFAYWMRCSEFSADRVSAYYHESAEPVIDVMMALSGGTPNLNLNLNREAFFRQAQNYKMLVDNSAYNKVLEFIQFGQIDHPLNAYRAYEINEFYKKFVGKLTFNSDDPVENVLVATIVEHALRIRFEYLKPKGFLKLGGLFDSVSLEVKIDKKKYTIDKNTSKDIVLVGGPINFVFKVDRKKISYSHNITYSTCLVVSWDSEKQKITVREEI